MRSLSCLAQYFPARRFGFALTTTPCSILLEARTQAIHRGVPSILSTLEKLPRTAHPLTDASKFVVDAWVMPNVMRAATATGGPGGPEKPEAVLFIAVHGEFTESEYCRVPSVQIDLESSIALSNLQPPRPRSGNPLVRPHVHRRARSARLPVSFLPNFLIPPKDSSVFVLNPPLLIIQRGKCRLALRDPLGPAHAAPLLLSQSMGSRCASYRRG